MQKGKPVPNAPGPDPWDIAKGTVQGMGATVKGAMSKTLANPPGTPPPKGENFGQGLKRNLKDLNQGLSQERLKGKESKNIVWGDSASKQMLKGKHPAGCTCAQCKLKGKSGMSEQRLKGPKIHPPKATTRAKAAKKPNPFSSQGKPAGPPRPRKAMGPPPGPSAPPFPPAQRAPITAGLAPPLPTSGPGMSYEKLLGGFQPGAGKNGVKRLREARHYKGK